MSVSEVAVKSYVDLSNILELFENDESWAFFKIKEGEEQLMVLIFYIFYLMTSLPFSILLKSSISTELLFNSSLKIWKFYSLDYYKVYKLSSFDKSNFIVKIF